MTSFHTDDLAPTFAVAHAILKGDVAGHSFHGNQFSGGIGGGGRAPIPGRFVDPFRWGATSIGAAARSVEPRAQRQTDMHHQEAQQYHALANKATGAMAGKLRDVANAHENAAMAHNNLRAVAHDTQVLENRRGDDDVNGIISAHATGQRLSEAQDRVDAAEKAVENAKNAAGVGNHAEGI